MPRRFQIYCKQCSHNVFYHKIVISCLPSRGCWVGQCDGDSSSSWNMWVNQLQRIGHNQLEGKASEIVVIGPVGDIARNDGTEWAGPVSGTID